MSDSKTNKIRYTNRHNIGLSVAVWLMRDTYDYVNDKKYISATTLMKPVRMIILEKRVNDVPDLSDLLNSRIGTSIHDSIEASWHSPDLSKILGYIGFPKEVADRMVVNPTEVKEGDLPVYIERRSYYKYKGYTIGGKFDICIDGILEDFKTTSVYTYIFDSRSDEFIQQGSIYRFLNQDIVTGNILKINYIFKDFSASKAENDPSYPPCANLTVPYPLMSIATTEEMIHQKIDMIDKYFDADESDLPLCSPEDLWLTEEKFAYFKNPSALRATKVYDTLEEAEMRKKTEGTGRIEKRGGVPKRCDYCKAQPICSQYRMMERNK